MSKPITPKECIEAQKNLVPERVINGINDLLKKRWDGESAIIYESDLAKMVESKTISYEYCRDAGILKFKPIYNEMGWNIEEKSNSESIYSKYWIFTVKNS